MTRGMSHAAHFLHDTCPAARKCVPARMCTPTRAHEGMDRDCCWHAPV